MNTAPLKRILVCVPREAGHCRDIIHGVFAYQQFHLTNWELNVQRVERSESLQRWDGCIVMDGSPRSTSIPCVDCSNGHDPEGVDSVCEDNRMAGRMAANFFLNQGYEHFLFVGIHTPLYSRQRGEGFRNSLPSPPTETTIWGPGWSEQKEFERLIQLMNSLPKPLAVFAGNDSVGLILLRLLRKTHMQVPEDVAVLGVDNDDLTCLLPHPTMSSVQLDGIGIGKEAARLLAARMEHPDVPLHRLRLPPLDIHVRGSTMDRAVPHPDVRKALAFIRRFSQQAIGVPDIVQATGLKRRALESHVRDATGRTLYEHLRDQRLQRARPLLQQSRLSIQEIAFQCGFQNAERFSVVFREQEGCSPREYRQRRST